MTQDTERLTVYGAVNLLECHGFEPPFRFNGNTLEWFREEVQAGRLVCHNHTGLRIEPGEHLEYVGLYGETTSRKELNAWLERIDHLRRVPREDTPAAPAPEPAPEPASAPASAPAVAVAPTPAPSASAPTVAAPEPAQKQKKPRRSWWDDVIGYLAEVLRAGKHRTARALHDGVQKLAGGQDSPFKVVCRKLYVNEAGQTLAVKTLQNRWAEVRAAAGMR